MPGLPAGVKFDPTDQEILEHLDAKVLSDTRKLHPLIDEFIPTLEGENGICYTHPEKLPGMCVCILLFICLLNFVIFGIILIRLTLFRLKMSKQKQGLKPLRKLKMGKYCIIHFRMISKKRLHSCYCD